MNIRFLLVLGLIGAFLSACAAGEADDPVATLDPVPAGSPWDEIAESYVKLVLGMGRHDADYVDAYYGPPEWKAQAAAAALTTAAIRARAADLRDALGDEPPGGADRMERMRHRFLRRQLDSLIARIDMLGGKTLSFDEESMALYDAVAPSYSEAHFRSIIEQLEELLPGSGPLHRRYDTYRNRFAIPPDRVDAVFQEAIAECRRRTERFIALPEDESFTVEYVSDKSWAGYNWYQGDYHSVIQVNSDLIIYIDRAIDLACHEGYPGHHVFNMLLEKNLVRDRGWMEFSVYPLFSPQSLIAEGTANYGIDIAFPGDERIRYERETLFPLAGLDAHGVEAYYHIQELAGKLNHAGNEAARRYLNGEIDAAGAADWLAKYALHSRARARQRIRFIDQYRSYVINYNLGKEIVRHFVETTAGPEGSPQRKWEVFAELLSSPQLPSDLQ